MLYLRQGRVGSTPGRARWGQVRCFGPWPQGGRARWPKFWPDPGPFGVGPGRPSGQRGPARPLDSVSRAASFSGSSLVTSKPSLEVIDAMALDLVSDLFLNCSTIRSSSLTTSRAGSFVVEEFVMVELEFLDVEDWLFPENPWLFPDILDCLTFGPAKLDEAWSPIFWAMISLAVSPLLFGPIGLRNDGIDKFKCKRNITRRGLEY
jgi:hypothetical protein